MTFSRRQTGTLLLAAALLTVACTVRCLAAKGLPAGGALGGHATPQGYLGIMFHDVADGDVSALHLKDKRGAEIIMVDHDGPAGKAGLRVKDVVLKLNGATVDGEEQLRKLLHEVPPGRTIQLVICRDGAEQTVAATLSTREEVIQQAQAQRWTVPLPADDAEATPQEPASRPSIGFGRSFMSGHLLSVFPVYTGATIDTVGQQLGEYMGVKDGKGLLVHAVENNSPAAAAGLRAGDIVIRMNGVHIVTERDWTRTLRDYRGKAIAVTVIRDHKEQTMTMIADGKKRSSVEMPPAPGEAGPLLMLR